MTDTPRPILPQPAPANRVTVVDFNMPFGSMIVFMLKWAIAAIPAMMMLIALGAFVSVLFAAAAAGMIAAARNVGAMPMSSGVSPGLPASRKDFVVTLRPTSGGWQVFNENATTWHGCMLTLDGHDARIPAFAGSATIQIANGDFSNGGAPRPEKVMDLDVSMHCTQPESDYATIHLVK